MSTRTVIIWLAVALVLGAAALYVAMRPAGGGAAAPRGSVAANERITDIDPAQVRAVEVRPPGVPVQRLERSPADPGQWTLTLGEGAAPGPRWPLMPQRVRSILQIVATVRAVAPADPGASVGEGATRVVFEMDDGSRHELLLAERTLGGTGLVEYTPPGEGGEAGEAGVRRAMVDDGFLAVFTNPGPREWRSLSALPGAGPELSRIRIEGQGGGGGEVIALARASGRWSLVEPVAAPANPAKVTQVIAALQNLTITDFLDGKRIEPALMRLDAPSTRIRIETDVRTAAADAGAAPEVSTRAQELALGGPADSSGKNLYASVREGGREGGSGDERTRTFAVDAAALASVLVTDPAAYIATAAAATAAADVGEVTLTPAGGTAGGGRKFKRSLNSWAEVTAAGAEAQMAEGDAAAVNEALAFLSTRGAAAVHISEPDGYTPAGTVALGSLAGAPLEEVGVGVLPGGSVGVRTGKVWRTYSAESAPRLLREWLAASGARAPEPPAPADGEITK